MTKNNRRIKKYFYHRSNVGVISITDNMNKWCALPLKKVLNHTTVRVDITPVDLPEEDSPAIIAYKKRKEIYVE